MGRRRTFPHRTYDDAPYPNASQIAYFNQTLPERNGSDDWPLRSVKETILRSVAIHLATSASYGHLMSLQQISSSRKSGGWMLLLLAMLGFLLFPTLPIAQTMRRIRGALRLARKRRGRGMLSQLFVVSCLGVVLTSADGRTDNLRPHQKSYSIKWFGRMLLLLLLIVQYCGTIFLWIRRFRQVKGFCLWALDNRNLESVLGGLWAVLLCAGIRLVNTEWKDRRDHNGRLSDDEERGEETELGVLAPHGASMAGADASLAGDLRSRGSNIGRDEEVSRQSHTRSTKSKESHQKSRRTANLSALRKNVPTISELKDLTIRQYRNFRQFNVRLSKATLKYYPHELQWDFELAYVLHLAFYSYIPVHFSGYPGAQWAEPSRIGYEFAGIFFRDRLKDPLMRRIPSCGERCTASFEFLVESIFLCPLFVIVSHYLLTLFVSHKMFKSLPVHFQDVLRGVDFWLRSGRTVVSLFASLLMALPFVVQFNHFTIDVYWYKPAEEWLAAIIDKGDNYSTWQREMLWKDPISSSLYVI
jgi:hypothetical protein